MLSPDEISRRLKAARELRQISQKEMGELFEGDGLNKSDPGRIERMDVAMRRSHRDAFVRHLRVPERWLTSNSLDELVGLVEPPETRLERIERKLDELVSQIEGDPGAAFESELEGQFPTADTRVDKSAPIDPAQKQKDQTRIRPL